MPSSWIASAKDCRSSESTCVTDASSSLTLMRPLLFVASIPVKSLRWLIVRNRSSFVELRVDAASARFPTVVLKFVPLPFRFAAAVLIRSDSAPVCVGARPARAHR